MRGSKPFLHENHPPMLAYYAIHAIVQPLIISQMTGGERGDVVVEHWTRGFYSHWQHCVVSLSKAH